MPSDSIQPYHRFYRVMIIIGIYTLLPFLLLNFYNHPSVDDFEFAVRDNQSSFLVTQIETYHNWSGRFFATGIARINPIRFDSFVGYKVSSFLLLLCYISMLHLLISTLFREFSLKQKLALSALIAVPYFSQMPSISHGLYWLSAYLAYQLANVLTLVILLLLINLFRIKHKVSKAAHTVLITAVCVAIVASNEMALVYLMTSLSLLLFQLWQHQHHNFRYVLVLFVCSLVASFLVVLAPGNYARMDLYPHDLKNLLWSVLASTVLIPTYFYKWGMLLVLASVLYYIFWKKAFACTIGSYSIFKVPIWLSLLHFLVTLFLMNFVFTWSRGTLPKPRAENAIFFFFVIGWFYNLHVAIIKHSAQFNQIRSSSILTGAIVFLFVRLILDIENNISTAYMDLLSGKASNYNKELNERYYSLKTSGCTTCYVKPLSDLPKSLYVEDITTNNAEERNLLVNRAYKKFWNKDAVFLAAPNPTVEEDNFETLRLVGRRIKYVLIGPGV